MPPIADFEAWSKRIPRTKLVVRNDFIVNFCRGRDVVHLGATDAPFTQEAGKAGRLLHQYLKPVCKTLVGMDYDQAGIDWLRENLGISDIVCRDLSRSDSQLQPLGDVVLCADIIEHVNAVGDLIFNCNRLCRDGGDLVLSTINATALRTSLRAMFGKEAVHPDHVAYYSFSTLAVMCRRFGFEPASVFYHHYGAVNAVVGLPFKLLFRFAPPIADAILLVARKVRSV